MSVIPLSEALDAGAFGGKAVHLGAAIRAGLPVPPGYAVSAESLERLKRDDPSVRSAVGKVFYELGPPVAARSSAIGEDSKEASFAGQHVTHLNLLTAEDTAEGLIAVYDSAHSESALAYRKKKGVASEIRIGAVIQKLVDPVCAGVLFTRNPVTGAHEHVIEAAWGLGETVVAGLVTPDHYRMSRDGQILEARPGEKDLAMRRAPSGGSEEVEVDPDLVHARCLDDAWLARLVDLAALCERHFGDHLDLEWAIAGGSLFLLQSRPISTQ